MVGFILCCLSCCVIVGLGYAVCCIGFRCHIIRVMQWWNGSMQCMVAVMVVCVYCGYEGGERFL